MDIIQAGTERETQIQRECTKMTRTTSLPNMAQQAMKVYDQDGETIMLDFIVANQANTGDYQQISWNAGIYNLEDGSMVENGGGNYLFWSNRASAAGKYPESRPATINKESIRFPGRVIPMVGWPNSISIQTCVLEAAETQAYRNMGRVRNKGPVLDIHTSGQLAPSLRDKVRETIRAREYKVPDELLDELDREMKLQAEMVLEELPPEEFKSLIRKATNRIKESNPAGTENRNQENGDLPHPEEEQPIREGDWRLETQEEARLFRIAMLHATAHLEAKIEVREYSPAPCRTLHLKEQDQNRQELSTSPTEPTYRRELGWCDSCKEYGYFNRPQG